MKLLTVFKSEESIRLNKKTLVILRWIAIIGQIVTISFVYFILNFEFPFLFCFLIIFFGILTNIFLQFKIKKSLLSNISSTLYLAYDLIQLAALIFLYFGLEYVALLSVLVGFSVLIPYLGAFIVTLPVAAVGLLQFNLTFEFWLLMGSYLALQILDGNLLVPLLFSDAVKLHPVVIILAVFIFGSLFGFWGVFFAIPIATLIKAIWNSWPDNLPN